MDFVTREYYTLFLPLVVVLILFIGRKRRDTQVLIILAMSYIFFWLASGWHVLLLLTSTLVDWTAGKKIHESDEHRIRKRWLIVSLIINLGLLAIFKYLDFLIETWNLASLRFNGAPELDTFGLLLPVGISFYTFQTMSYTIDIYREKHGPYERFVDFACYAAFFPQLVAGPIVRSQHFLEQIQKPVSSNPHRFRLGLTLIIYGLSKKLIIADNVALHVNAIFADGVPLDNIGLVWWGALCFGIQIYCDFSAYTDIALGSGHLIGIELPENFKSPYAAKSPQDFWRRWHISLSTWLRDYLYIPLGGSRNGTRALIFALMGTMLLGGLWHGASWNFVLWGAMHGILLLAHRWLIQIDAVKNMFDSAPKLMLVGSWMITQYFVFMTWLVFRVEDTSMMLRSLKSFMGIDAHWDQMEFIEALPEIRLLTYGLVGIFIIAHGFSGKIGGLKYWLAKQNPLVWGTCCGIIITATILLRPAETIDFIYFRF
ncbi:MAG: MBOAT family O-acyltransferase [Candidatus Poseidoniaceae archaeon]